MLIGAAALWAAASCAGAPPERPEPPVEKPPRTPPTLIMGRGALEAEELEAFLLKSNPAVAPDRARELAGLYVQEAAAEGVNHDAAFAQMCLETGFLRFGGLVTADMHNYCGLGSIGPGQPGERFPSARIGVRAHVQHLKAYASAEDLRNELVDPRYRFVKLGSAPAIADLAGRWAADREYGRKLADLLERMYRPQ